MRKRLISSIASIALAVLAAASVQSVTSPSHAQAAYHWRSKASKDRYLRWYYATHPAATPKRPLPPLRPGTRYTTFEWQGNEVGAKTYTSTVVDTSGAAYPGVDIYVPMNVSSVNWLDVAGTSKGWTKAKKRSKR